MSPRLPYSSSVPTPRPARSTSDIPPRRKHRRALNVAVLLVFVFLPLGALDSAASALSPHTGGTAPEPGASSRVVTTPKVTAPRGSQAKFPNARTTGVPARITLKAYHGPCTITRDRTVIDSKRVTCGLVIRARHVVIRNSSLRTVWLDQDIMHAQGQTGWSVHVSHSTVNGGRTDGPGVCCGNYHVSHVEMRGGHNGAQCENGARYCTLKDSWIHAQYEPAGGQRHLGGFLNDGGTPSTLVHNRITCDARAENDEGGCTGDINLIPNFGVMAHVLVQNNYLGANANSAYCTYAGAAPGLAGYANRSNHIVYKGNVFAKVDTIANPAPGQPGHTRRCAAYGPVTGFDVGGPGNVWTGNRWDNGKAVVCNRRHRCD